MALVRVYCGLAAAEPRQQPGATSVSLTTALVDDAGRLLDVRDIEDHPEGYACLSSLLAERASGPYSVAIATDSEQHLVSRLLAAAGWALAVTENRVTDDFADRFADELTDEPGAVSPRRRALGLARALHAGVLAATTMPAPPDLADLKPVLAADCALATGRYAAAVALREVLRELYPAALRAYPDPADPVALAVMDALPEPGTLAASSGGRGRDAAAAADAVTARLTADGIADPATITEAITALRVAIAETPRRGVSRALAATVAATVRKTVAAVRACDESRSVLISALAERVWSPPAAPVGPAVPGPRPPQPMETTPSATAASTPNAPSGAHPGNGYAATPTGGYSAQPPLAGYASFAPAGGYPASGHAGGYAAPSSPAGYPAQAPASGRPASGPGGSRPVSSPPPPPPGITPIAEPHQTGNRARPWGDRPAQPQGYAPAPAASHSGASSAPDPGVPTPRSTPEGPPPGSRSGWPTSPPADDWAVAPPAPSAPPAPAASPAQSAFPASPAPASGPSGPPATGFASSPAAPVAPPWLADDLQLPEPPPLRLVEPTLPEELRNDLGYGGWSEPPPLRLVDPEESIPRSIPPVDAAESDGDLLIFAQARSAWFTGQDTDNSWNSIMDVGWQAAEQASRPAVDDHTNSGLPRRVPHANLVPGSPPTDNERPLRVVRDPASIAAHTSGYFNGWRRGQEVGGYALGTRSRPGAGAWDFARDDRLSS